MANDVNAMKENQSGGDGKRKAKKELNKIRDDYFGSDEEDLDYGNHRQRQL